MYFSGRAAKLMDVARNAICVFAPCNFAKEPKMVRRMSAEGHGKLVTEDPTPSETGDEG